MNKYYIAEINVAEMKGDEINDPIMKEFAENLDAVNKIAEQSKGNVCFKTYKFQKNRFFH